MSDAVLGEPVGQRFDLRLVAVTAPDGALHVLATHIDGAQDAAHVSLGGGLLADAFRATRCASDDELADLVAHALPLDPSAQMRRVEIVHLGAAQLRPASLSGPFGARYECVHGDAPLGLDGRAWLLASASVPGGPWVVAIGAHTAESDVSQLERARAAAGEASPFAPCRVVFGDSAGERFDVVDARIWCREMLEGREVPS